MQSFLKETYPIIRNNLFNGVFAYLIFALYSLTLSPILTHYFSLEEKNVFVSIFGFIILVAEFFAINIKLQMIRMRSEEKRAAYKNETGIDIIPSVSPFVLLGFFMRFIFRISILMVAINASGYKCTDMSMSPQGLIFLMTGFVVEFLGLIYIFSRSIFYTDPPENKKELKEILQEKDEWKKQNHQLLSSEKYFKLELYSDIILQVYAVMLYTSFWKYINDTAIEMMRNSLLPKSHDSLLMTFLMVACVSALGLMPIRIAYWIEDSMGAISRKEKIGMWSVFFTAVLFTCAPFLSKFISLIIFNQPDLPNQHESWYLNYIIPIVSFLTLLFIQIFLFRMRRQKVSAEKEK